MKCVEVKALQACLTEGICRRYAAVGLQRGYAAVEIGDAGLPHQRSGRGGGVGGQVRLIATAFARRGLGRREEALFRHLSEAGQVVRHAAGSSVTWPCRMARGRVESRCEPSDPQALKLGTVRGVGSRCVCVQCMLVAVSVPVPVPVPVPVTVSAY